MTNIITKLITDFINYNIKSITERLTIPALLNHFILGMVARGLNAGLTNGYEVFIEKSVNLKVVNISIKATWVNSII